MKIYVAAPYDQKPLVHDVHALITARGHEPTSGWAHVAPDEAQATPHTRQLFARYDLHDLRRATHVLILNVNESTSGGMWVELGYVLHTMAPARITLIGPPTNVFCELIEHIDLLEDSDEAAILETVTIAIEQWEPAV